MCIRDSLRAEPLPEQVDDRLVERLALAALLALEGFREAGRQIPDRQCLDLPHPPQSIYAFIECSTLQHQLRVRLLGTSLRPPSDAPSRTQCEPGCGDQG